MTQLLPLLNDTLLMFIGLHYQYLLLTHINSIIIGPLYQYLLLVQLISIKY